MKSHIRHTSQKSMGPRSASGRLLIVAFLCLFLTTLVIAQNVFAGTLRVVIPLSDRNLVNNVVPINASTSMPLPGGACNSDCTYTYDGQVKFLATADTGWGFFQWTTAPGTPINATQSNPSVNIDIFPPDSITVTADFIQLYQITTISDVTVSESDSTAVFTVTLDRAPAGADVVTVDYVTADGSADVGSDYTITSGTLTFNNGTTASLTIPVPILNDTLVEPSETFTVALSNPSVNATITDATGTGTITDNDTAQVNIGANDAVAAEPADNGQFTVTLTNLSDTATQVSYSVAGTATPGSDYTALTGSVTIAANTLSATIDVSVVNDDVLEDNETVEVTLTGITGGDGNITLGGGTTAVVTISDEDAAEVNIGANDAVAAEPADNGQFTVTLTNLSDTATQVSYSVAGTATPGSDYTALTGSVTIAANTLSATIDVSVVNDDVLEDNETVEVTLTGITGGDGNITLGGGTTAVVTISDEDAAEVNIGANDAVAAEPADNGQFTVTLTNLSDTATQVSYSVAGTATPGSDYTALTGSVTIAANTLSATIDVSVVNDDVLEDNETVEVTLTGITGGDGNITLGGGTTAVVTISDEDAAEVNIGANDAVAAEPADNGQFTVTLTNLSDTATQVSYSVAGTATPGSDYTALTGSVTIAANTLSATIDVSVVNDDVLEDNETVEVTLTGITGGDGNITLGGGTTAVVTISDEDAAEVNIGANDAVAAEPADNGQFTVTLTNSSDTATQVSYSVAGTATPGSDYTALTGSVTIAANTLSATIDVSVVNDDVLEDNETVEVTLTGITGGDGNITLGGGTTAVVTISDEDAAEVNIGANDAVAAEPADNGQFTVTLTNLSDTATQVSYSVAGTATPGSDYTALTGSVTIAANTLSATIDVSVVNDDVLEDNETVDGDPDRHYRGDGNITLGGGTTAVATISDEDAAEVNIGANDAVAAEPADNGQFTVTLTNSSDTATQVSYSVAGTATPGSDYTALTGSVTIAANTLSATIDVSVVNDDVLEDNETVEVTLTGITGGDGNITLGGGTTAVVTISDEDAAEVNIGANDAVAAEPADNGQFTVTLTNLSDTATQVSYSVAGTATPGSDYTALTGSVTIAANTLSATIDVSVVNDDVLEDNETVEVTLTGITGGDGNITLGGGTTAVVTISDEDAALASISATITPAAEPGTNGMFAVILSNPSSTATQVSYSVAGTATPGSDYTALTGSVTIPAGSVAGAVPILVLDDSVVEANETVTVTLNRSPAVMRT